MMNMWSSTPAGEMVPGFDSLRERAITFAKDNAEAAFAQGGKASPSQGCARFDDASKPLRASADEILCHSSAGARTTDDNGHAKHAVTQALTPCRLRCDAPSAMSALGHWRTSRRRSSCGNYEVAGGAWEKFRNASQEERERGAGKSCVAQRRR